MIARRQKVLLVPLLLALSSCSASEPAKPIVDTQTNEQGCVSLLSTGPQDPTAIPVPVKQACVGPYLLELPQNYFYNQMGTEFDGSFALALEYPKLEPFQPGERSNLTADVGVRTVMVRFNYIDRIDIHQAMRNSYTNTTFAPDNPAASLEGRLIGEQMYGLTPYYADLERIRAHWRQMGASESAPAMQVRWNEDWYVERGDDGEVKTIIKCTSRNMIETGVEYRDGKMVKNDVRELPKCDHFFAIADHDIKVHMTYVRVALPDWKRIEDRARSIFLNNTSARANTDGVHK